MPDKFTWYAIISAFWLAFLAILGVNLAGGVIMPTEQTVETFGYPVEVPEVMPTATADAGADERPNIIALIAVASLDDGATAFRKCTSCHSVDAGTKPMTGPNLHNVVGREIGAVAGFNYSESLLAIGGVWDYQKLDDYLNDPKHLAPRGTMNFAGLKRHPERAAMIKFLMENTDNPPPLPEVPVEEPAEAAPADAAPADGAPADAAPAQ